MYFKHVISKSQNYIAAKFVQSFKQLWHKRPQRKIS